MTRDTWATWTISFEISKEKSVARPAEKRLNLTNQRTVVIGFCDRRRVVRLFRDFAKSHETQEPSVGRREKQARIDAARLVVHDDQSRAMSLRQTQPHIGLMSGQTRDALPFERRPQHFARLVLTIDD